MSCYGCRALRKGCPNDCTLRAALQWIDSAESQANATLFLAKFYGRTGLINLLNAAGPTHLRPEVLRSLLYEACGRFIDPVHGSVGLLCSGYWPRCEKAMESVLKTGKVVATDSNGSTTVFLGHARARTRVKRNVGPDVDTAGFEAGQAKFTISGWDEQMNRDNSVEKVQPELELSLGLNPVSQAYISSVVIHISDNET